MEKNPLASRFPGQWRVLLSSIVGGIALYLESFEGFVVKAADDTDDDEAVY